MTEISARLGLPYLLPSQAQKHVTHNAALHRLDGLVQLVLEATGAETPPADPAEGAIWALGPAPGGAWAGQGGALALWAEGGWSFLLPRPGWRAWDLARGALCVWQGGAWATLLPGGYEQGDWIPVAADAATGGSPAAAATAQGRYTRIGDLVQAAFALAAIDTTGLSGGNPLHIRGLPYAAQEHASAGFTGAVRLDQVTFAQPPCLVLPAGQSALQLVQNISGGSAAPLDVAALSSGSAAISGCLTYRV